MRRVQDWSTSYHMGRHLPQLLGSRLMTDPTERNEADVAGLVERPAINDEWIAERWPDEDVAEVRRRFDALMDKLGDTPWKGVPRFPEAMQPVLAWAAMLPHQRAEMLIAALADVPEHLRDYLWVAEKQAFGEQRLKTENVVGDNGHGMGRQAIAITPYIKGYNLAPWIAAASPGNVGALLATLTTYAARIAELEAEVAARDEALLEARGIVESAEDALDTKGGCTCTFPADDCCAVARARAFLARNTDGGGK
jgi:hypothetical protein